MGLECVAIDRVEFFSGPAKELEHFVVCDCEEFAGAPQALDDPGMIAIAEALGDLMSRQAQPLA